MNDIFEANKALMDTSKQLILRVKDLKAENVALRTQISSTQNSLTLTDEQKAEIEQLLAETKAVLTEDTTTQV